MLKYKKSFYNYCGDIGEGKYAVYNTLYGSYALINSAEYKFLSEECEVNLSPQTTEKLIENGFLIKDSVDEFEAFMTLSRLYRKQDLVYNLTILPTTKCNARCFYCYEEGVSMSTMTDECTDAIVKYITELNTKRGVFIHWFGGEPLMNMKPINFISAELKKRKIKFASTITTNAILLNKKIIERAVEQWNVIKVQITLDGTKEEYEKRKNYINNKKDAYEIVLNNIEEILKTKIEVSIRMNIDSQNVNNIYELFEYLLNRFSDYPNVSIYPAFLEGCENSIILNEEKYVIIQQLFKIAKALGKKAFNCFGANTVKKMTSRPLFIGCELDNPGSVIISADGHIFSCDHDIGKKEKSNGIIYEKYNQNCKKCVYSEKMPQKCVECVFLPRCFGGCNDERDKNSDPCNSIVNRIKIFMTTVV